MDAPARAWFDRHTFGRGRWSAVELLALKRARSTRVSVVLPALDEQDTVGEIVRIIRAELVEAVPLVDELVVVDSGSTDGTAAEAARAGATVLAAADVLRRCGARPGKGEALWKGLSATTGDVVVFVDADLQSFTAGYVVGLVGPLLIRPELAFIKAFYDRPLGRGPEPARSGGGRVTELVARPLLNLHWPQLAGLVQPLAGEYAARRSVLERVPFVSGYGVEIGLLIDVLALAGPEAFAQTDLGRRTHGHQDNNALGRMSSEIMQTVLDRLGREGRLAQVEPPWTALTQFLSTEAGYRPRTADVTVTQRPPLISVPDYRVAMSRSGFGGAGHGHDQETQPGVGHARAYRGGET